MILISTRRLKTTKIWRQLQFWFVVVWNLKFHITSTTSLSVLKKTQKKPKKHQLHISAVWQQLQLIVVQLCQTCRTCVYSSPSGSVDVLLPYVITWVDFVLRLAVTSVWSLCYDVIRFCVIMLYNSHVLFSTTDWQFYTSYVAQTWRQTERCNDVEEAFWREGYVHAFRKMSAYL